MVVVMMVLMVVLGDGDEAAADTACACSMFWAPLTIAPRKCSHETPSQRWRLHAPGQLC